MGVCAASVLITAFTIAYGLFQVVHGPLGDRFGKLRIDSIALILAGFATAGCARAADLHSLAIFTNGRRDRAPPALLARARPGILSYAPQQGPPMNKLDAGKLPAALLAELLADGPPLPPEVRLGPAIGEDACAIDLDGGVLIAATDPITLTGDAVGAHAVMINANDVAVMGVRPRWFLATILLPLGTTVSQTRVLFGGMREALDSLGVALVGGHTEVTPVVTQAVVVGQMLGFAADGRVVPTSGMNLGDYVVQIGAAPIEGTGVLASAFRDELNCVDANLPSRAAAALKTPGICVVEAALLATKLGALALHDPTEGGLSAGLYELARASGTGIDIDAQAVLWFDDGLTVCKFAGVDPWGVLASGTVLAAFASAAANDAVAALNDAGHRAAVIGIATNSGAVTLNCGTALAHFERDEVARVLDQRQTGVTQ